MVRIFTSRLFKLTLKAFLLDKPISKELPLKSDFKGNFFLVSFFQITPFILLLYRL